MELQSAVRCVNLGRRDVDSAKFNCQPSRQTVHCLLRDVKAVRGSIHRQDIDRRALPGNCIARATFRRVPTGDRVDPSDVGPFREGTEGGVAFAKETVDAVGTSDIRQGEGSIVVRCVVRESLLRECGKSECQRSGSKRYELHGVR